MGFLYRTRRLFICQLLQSRSSYRDRRFGFLLRQIQSKQFVFRTNLRWTFLRYQWLQNCILHVSNHWVYFQRRCLSIYHHSLKQKLPIHVLALNHWVHLHIFQFICKLWTSMSQSLICLHIYHSRVIESIVWPMYSCVWNTLDLVLENLELLHARHSVLCLNDSSFEVDD